MTSRLQTELHRAIPPSQPLQSFRDPHFRGLLAGGLPHSQRKQGKNSNSGRTKPPSFGEQIALCVCVSLSVFCKSGAGPGSLHLAGAATPSQPPPPQCTKKEKEERGGRETSPRARLGQGLDGRRVAWQSKEATNPRELLHTQGRRRRGESRRDTQGIAPKQKRQQRRRRRGEAAEEAPSPGCEGPAAAVPSVSPSAQPSPSAASAAGHLHAWRWRQLARRDCGGWRPRPRPRPTPGRGGQGGGGGSGASLLLLLLLLLSWVSRRESAH